jgi:hypothetical protein
MDKIFALTILYGAIPLFVVTIIQAIIEGILKIHEYVPAESRNDRGFALYFFQFVSDLFFFVLIPALVYFWINPIIPFTGFRAGVAVGIGAYVLGSLPYATNLSLRIKVPSAMIVSTLFFNLIKLTASLGVITYYINS